MASLRLDDHFCSCSVAALENVSMCSAKDTLIAYIKQLKTRDFSSKDKKYHEGYRFGYYIHVFFSGPKHAGWLKEHWDHHHSLAGSCDQFAAFLREEKLGQVIQTAPRWNHRHASRPKGQGDVVAYIWSPDPDALAAWWDKNNPDKVKTNESA